jgi:PDZ domain-containing protein
VFATRIVRRSLGVALAVLAIVVAVLWFTPSNHFVFLPDPAQPVDPIVSLPNEEEDEAEAGGIYFLEVAIRRATVFERFFPRLLEGSTLVPEREYNPRGLSSGERRKVSLNEMSRSQEIAVAVALRELGYDVEAEPFGAEVAVVLPDSDAAGRLQPGDIIVGVEGKEVRTVADLRSAFEAVEPGDEVTITVRRSGGRREYTFSTRAAQDDPERAVIGIEIQQAADIELPIDVRFDSGSIGGPSAGLAFALDIVDELGDDLDLRRRIAVTGELDLEGNVSPIGGVKQKTIGAEEAGADVLVLPRENAAEARRHAEDIDIVAVSTFDEALSKLATN